MRLENVLGWSYSPTTNELTVEMAYLGGILSVNRYKWGVFTRPEVRQWMDELAFIIRTMVNSQNIKFDVPLKVKVGGQFKDKRSMPDADNTLKIIGDSISMGLGIDDKHFIYETKPFSVVKAQQPKLIMVMTGGFEASCPPRRGERILG